MIESLFNPYQFPTSFEGRVSQDISQLRGRIQGQYSGGSTVQQGAITTPYIATGAITAGTIAAGTIVAGNIAANTITAGQIAANTITAGQVAANTLTAGQIAADTITAGQIAANAITASELAAGSITAADMLANTITAAQVAVGTLTGDRLVAGTLTATQIAAGTITGDRLVAGTITATQISVSSLSAISANLGTITAGTITGGTFQSSGSDPRVVMDSTGVYARDASGFVTFKADASTGKIITLAGIGGGNALNNASFEDPTVATHWQTTNCTIASSTTFAKHGARSLKMTPTGTGTFYALPQLASRPGAIAGKEYTLSAWFRPDPAAAIRNVRCTIDWRNSSNTTLGTASGTPVLAVLGDWVRATVTATAPAGVQDVRVQLEVTGTGTTADVYYVDAAQFEEGRLVTAFAPKPDEVLPQTIGGASGGSHIITGSVAAGDLVANSITAAQVAAGTLTATQIQAGSITADRLNVTQLSAIAANLGTITAGTITGATIRTAVSGARVELSGSSFKKYDAGGNIAVSVDATNGLDLLAGTAALTETDRRIRWLDGSGNEVAGVRGYRISNENVAVLGVPRATTHGDQAVVIVGMDDGAGGFDSKLQITQIPGLGGSPPDASDVSVTAMTQTRQLIGSDGLSDFLQLQGGAANRKVAFGSVTLTGGAGIRTGTATVAHGLGTAPIYAIGVASLSSINIAVTAKDGTNVTFQGNHIDGTTSWGSVTLYWLAIA